MGIICLCVKIWGVVFFFCGDFVVLGLEFEIGFWMLDGGKDKIKDRIKRKYVIVRNRFLSYYLILSVGVVKFLILLLLLIF